MVYATDGYWDFPLLAMNVGNAQVDGSMPESILVAIAYAGADPDVLTLREWDLTPGIDPSFDPTGSVSGHAQDFLGVITSQIIPFTESTYRVDTSFRVLTGSSYGGLFALYAMFEKPGLFQAVVASSPAVWWANESVLAMARSYAATGASLNTRVFVSYATEDLSVIIGPTQDLAQQLPGLAIPGISFAAREIEGERHSSTKPESYNRGLRFAFANIAPVPPSALKPGFGSRATFMNMSTRGIVQGGKSPLIAGLVISGIQPKRVLIRAAGPSLSSYGVSSPLADPKFSIVDSNQNVVGSNDNWGDAPNLSDVVAATSQAGAFPFVTGSHDAAGLFLLNPGSYTVVVDSTPGAEGVALVEAYEVLP